MTGLTRAPLHVSLEWVSRIVTTDPPRLVPHVEWRLALKLSAATPFRVAVFLGHGGETAWGLRPDPPSTEIEVSADFFPYDWADSDEVQIHFGWQRVQITDAALKAAPREAVRMTAPPAAEIGEIVHVAEIPAHAVTLAALSIAEQDIERRRHDRWRIKRRLASHLPEALVPLAGGQQSGVIRGGQLS